MDLVTLAIVAVIGFALLKTNILKGGLGGGGGGTPTPTPAPGGDGGMEGGGTGGESEGEYGDEGGTEDDDEEEGGNGYGGGSKGGKRKGGGKSRATAGGHKRGKGGYDDDDEEDDEMCQTLIMALIRGVRVPPQLLERCKNVRIKGGMGRYPIPFSMFNYTGIPASYYRQKYSHSRGRYTTLSHAYGRRDPFRDAYTTRWGYY